GGGRRNIARAGPASGPSTFAASHRGDPGVHHQAHAVRRHVSLRPAHVRDAGRVGDRLHAGRAVGPDGRLRERVAGADKVVYSSTLAAPPTANTRLERHFDPTAVLDLKAAATR